MSIAGHVSIKMLHPYPHIRQEAKRKVVAAFTTSQLSKWKAGSEEPGNQSSKKSKRMPFSKLGHKRRLAACQATFRSDTMQ